MRLEDLKKLGIPDEKPLGIGNERVVFNDPKNEDRIISVRRSISETPEALFYIARVRYHLIKIMHLLFPDNIPDIHFSYSRPEAMSRDKVELDEKHNFLRDFEVEKVFGDELPYIDHRTMTRLEGEISSHPAVVNLEENLRKAGFLVDPAGRNFGFDKDENVKFVDTPIESLGAYSTERMRNAIETQLQGEKRQQALHYLDRLLKAQNN